MPIPAAVPIGIMAAQTAISLGSFLFGLKNRPKIPGVTGQQRAVAASNVRLQDRLLSSTGLSDTEYQRYQETASDIGEQQFADLTGAARNVSAVSPLVAERIAAELIAKRAGTSQKISEDLLALTRKRIAEDLSAGMQAGNIAMSSATQIANQEREAALLKQQQQQQMMASLNNIFSGLSKNALSMYSLSNQPGMNTDTGPNNIIVQDPFGPKYKDNPYAI